MGLELSKSKPWGNGKSAALHASMRGMLLVAKLAISGQKLNIKFPTTCVFVKCIHHIKSQGLIPFCKPVCWLRCQDKKKKKKKKKQQNRTVTVKIRCRKGLPERLGNPGKLSWIFQDCRM